MPMYMTQADEAKFRAERKAAFVDIALYASRARFTKYRPDFKIIANFFRGTATYNDAYEAKSRISGQTWKEEIVSSNLSGALEHLFATSWHNGHITVTAFLNRGL